MGTAVAFAWGTPAAATAKAPHAGHSPVKPPVIVAHAAGHKIA